MASCRIVSWNVNGLYNTLKDATHRHSSVQRYFTEILAGDIICFQEAKIQEDKLEKWMACVPGYESFWAFSQEKKGYSGVVTYVKENLSPLDAKADCFGDDNDSFTDDLCNEGRLMYTDHGNFVLLNVYVPNAGDRSEGRPRLNFKLRFLKALENLCSEIVNSGKHVVIVGDFNIAHRNIDVHKKWKVEEIYSEEERGWLDAFLIKYTDLYRHFHPDDQDVFSVWNQKTEARIHNEGLRIDYAICDKGFVSEVLDVEIKKMFPKNWSDHAAIILVLKRAPVLPVHPSPAMSSVNMKRFQDDHKQKRITSLFSRASVIITNPSETESNCNGFQTLEIQSVVHTDGAASMRQNEGIPQVSKEKIQPQGGTKRKAQPEDKSDLKQKTLLQFLNKGGQ